MEETNSYGLVVVVLVVVLSVVSGFSLLSALSSSLYGRKTDFVAVNRRGGPGIGGPPLLLRYGAALVSRGVLFRFFNMFFLSIVSHQGQERPRK